MDHQSVTKFGVWAMHRIARSIVQGNLGEAIFNYTHKYTIFQKLEFHIPPKL